MRHLSALIVAASVSCATAQPADLAAKFGARPAVTAAALSPDGKALAYLTPLPGTRSAVVVMDLVAGTAKAVTSDRDNNFSLRWCGWKTERRLICGLSTVGRFDHDLAGFTRTIAVDRDGSNARVLGAKEGQFSGSVIDWLPDDPDHVLMTVNGVARVDVHTNQFRPFSTDTDGATGFISDGRGRIGAAAIPDRSGTGYARKQYRWIARPRGTAKWSVIVNTAAALQTSDFDMLGFDDAGTHVYALKPLDGRKALYRIAADGSRTELVFAHPKVDVDGIIRVGKYNRPVAATYTVDHGQQYFLDPPTGTLVASLRRALGGKLAVDIVDESWDGARKLVFAGSDAAPGKFYIYDTATRKLEELVEAYPQLKALTVAPMRAVSYRAADGTEIPGYLTLPPGRADAKGLPAIVMPHGGPAARDAIGFDWLSQYFAQAGYAVLQPNFRGSSGYGDKWFADNGFKSWRLAVGDINDGARWLAAQGADKDRLAIFGWSYGGYAALQANVLDPALYKAAIAVAPVTDLPQLKIDSQNYSEYRLVRDFVGSGPHLTEGSPARNADAIRAPVLMFHGDKDINVDVVHARKMDAALARAGKTRELVIYPGLDHQLVDGAARADMLKRSTDFLAKAMGGAPVMTAAASAR